MVPCQFLCNFNRLLYHRFEYKTKLSFVQITHIHCNGKKKKKNLKNHLLPFPFLLLLLLRKRFSKLKVDYFKTTTRVSLKKKKETNKNGVRA